MFERKLKNQRFLLNPQRLREFVVLIFLCVSIGYLFSSCSKSSEKTETVTPAAPTSAEIVQTMANDMSGLDFSTFKHESPQHNRLTCLLCHVRSTEYTTPKMPGHTPCASCHVQQFEDKSNAICTSCHTNKDTGEIKNFPPLKSFNVQFNHTAHFKETNCATCHKTETGGGMTIPSAADAHANCFQCHLPEKIVGEKNIGSCSTCHQTGTLVRITDSVKKIGFNFDHTKHSGVNCASCHNSTSENQMSAIKISMHSNSSTGCASCHNEKTAFGADDFSDCRRCHQEFAGVKSLGVNFSHSDHTKANCVACHKSSGGINFSVPNGEPAHTTCFQCHSPTKQTGNFNTSYCLSCHQKGNTSDFVPSAKTIAGNFSHTKHKQMSCVACHNSNGKEMSAPTIAMHKTTGKGVNCATCHNEKKAFGGDDFSDCKRCHTNNNFKF